MSQELARFDPLREGDGYMRLPPSLTSVTGLYTQIKKIVEGGKVNALSRHWEIRGVKGYYLIVLRKGGREN
jgi:hypothetical protein